MSVQATRRDHSSTIMTKDIRLADPRLNLRAGQTRHRRSREKARSSLGDAHERSRGAGFECFSASARQMVAHAWSLSTRTSLSAASARLTTGRAGEDPRLRRRRLVRVDAERLRCEDSPAENAVEDSATTSTSTSKSASRRFEPRVPRERGRVTRLGERFYRTHSGVGLTGGGGRETIGVPCVQKNENPEVKPKPAV